MGKFLHEALEFISPDPVRKLIPDVREDVSVSMRDQDPDALDRDHFLGRQVLEAPPIAVAHHRLHRGNLLQLADHVRRGDVAGMDDQIHTLFFKGRQDIRVQCPYPVRDVGVGNHANADVIINH